MKLVHYTSRRFLKIRSVEQVSPSTEKDGRRKGYRYLGDKPNGLWISDAEDYGWLDWCTDEDFHVELYTFAHKVELKKNARILYIRTDKQLLAFTKKYELKDGSINKVLRESHERFNEMNPELTKFMHERKPTIWEIDWPRVASKYQGIVITPYLWNLRLHNYTQWYYGWDCASGCIWDHKAIKHRFFLPFSIGRKVKLSEEHEHEVEETTV
jgi:hypothetical protein